MKMIRTIYLDPRWGEIQESKENGSFEVFRFSDESGSILYPFIVREAGAVGSKLYYDIVTPRGESGPVVLEQSSPELFSRFDSAFQVWCGENGIVAEYIRFDPWNTDPGLFSGIYDINPHGYAYCHGLQEDFFYTQYNTKRRNQIRKAQKNEVEIVTDAGWDRIDDFLKLYAFTVEKHSVSDYYLLSRSFLDKYKELLGSRVKLGLAWRGDTLVAAGLFLNGGDVFHYHFSASHPDYTELNAISLLLYEEAKLGAAEGCSIMDLGGATPNSGLELFKRSMVKPEGILPCFVGTKVRDRAVYDELVRQSGDTRPGFFPAYRFPIRG